MKASFVISIPYGDRSKYFETIAKICSLVDNDGTCILCVNNIPYKLEILFVVQTKENIEKISDILDTEKLSINATKGLTEISKEVSAKKWDMYSLPKDNNDLLFSILHEVFIFAEKSELRKNGYDVDVDIKRKKIFVSYCHKDKRKVRNIVEKLKQAGFYMWFDEQEIDVGDNVLECISDGIRDCNLALLFLSHNTLQANMAKHELNTFLQKTIYSQKKIAPIVLDDVNVNHIFEGLGNYNYFSYRGNSKIDELIEAMEDMVLCAQTEERLKNPANKKLFSESEIMAEFNITSKELTATPEVKIEL